MKTQKKKKTERDGNKFGDFKDTDTLDIYLQTLVNLIYRCL